MNNLTWADCLTNSVWSNTQLFYCGTYLCGGWICKWDISSREYIGIRGTWDLLDQAENYGFGPDITLLCNKLNMSIENRTELIEAIKWGNKINYFCPKSVLMKTDELRAFINLKHGLLDSYRSSANPVSAVGVPLATTDQKAL